MATVTVFTYRSVLKNPVPEDIFRMLHAFSDHQFEYFIQEIKAFRWKQYWSDHGYLIWAALSLVLLPVAAIVVLTALPSFLTSLNRDLAVLRRAYFIIKSVPDYDSYLRADRSYLLRAQVGS